MQLFDYAVGQRVPLHLLDALEKPVGCIVESMEDDVLQAQPPELRDGFERRRVERDVADQRERWVALEQPGDRADVEGAVRRRVKNDDAYRFSPDEGLELLPRRGDQKLRLISKNVLEVSEESGGQERSNAQGGRAHDLSKVSREVPQREGF